MQFAQKMMQPRSPSEFVEFLSTHMRERATAITEQAKELATLGQEAAKKAAELVHAPKELSERAPEKIRRPAAPTAGRSRFDQAAAHCSASRIS